jgi:hypothetical protein
MKHKKKYLDSVKHIDIGDPLLGAGLHAGGGKTIQGVKVKKIPRGKRAMTEKSWKKARDKNIIKTGKTYGYDYGGGGF